MQYIPLHALHTRVGLYSIQRLQPIWQHTCQYVPFTVTTYWPVHCWLHIMAYHNIVNKWITYTTYNIIYQYNTSTCNLRPQERADLQFWPLTQRKGRPNTCYTLLPCHGQGDTKCGWRSSPRTARSRLPLLGRDLGWGGTREATKVYKYSN